MHRATHGVKVEKPHADGLVQLPVAVLLVAVEWLVAAQQDVEQHAERPHVRRLSVPAVRDDFGGHVAGRADEAAVRVQVPLHGSQAKVSQHGLRVLRAALVQHVLRLQRDRGTEGQRDGEGQSRTR